MSERIPEYSTYGDPSAAAFYRLHYGGDINGGGDFTIVAYGLNDLALHFLISRF